MAKVSDNLDSPLYELFKWNLASQHILSVLFNLKVFATFLIHDKLKYILPYSLIFFLFLFVLEKDSRYIFLSRTCFAWDSEEQVSPSLV